jgi:hypothetical protein
VADDDRLADWALDMPLHPRDNRLILPPYIHREPRDEARADWYDVEGNQMDFRSECQIGRHALVQPESEVSHDGKIGAEPRIVSRHSVGGERIGVPVCETHDPLAYLRAVETLGPGLLEPLLQAQ